MARKQETTNEELNNEELNEGVKIKLLQNVKYGETSHKIGEVITVQEDELKHILKNKIGEVVEE